MLRKKLAIVKLCAVLVILIGLVQNSVGHQSNETTSRPIVSAANTTSAEIIETSPSITSVHQVWTASSSDSLDELSPDMISKLRNDVPFLAAYALRPRLVGAAVPTTVLPSMPQSQNQRQQEQSLIVSHDIIPKLDTSSSERSPLVMSNIKTSARQQLVSTKAISPKLADFSEFQVETSSTSKSEHHHKRKTSLKRQQAKKNKRAHQASLGSSQLTKQKRAKAKKTSKKHGSTFRRKLSGQKSRVVKASNRLQLSSKRNRNGRFSLTDSIGSETKSNGLDNQMISNTKPLTDDGLGIKGQEADGTKGGASGSKRPPFFASKRPVSDEGSKKDDNSDEASRSNGRDESVTSGMGTTATDEEDNNTFEDSPSGGDLDDDEPQGEPKRVGDDDVEEGGDTVLIEPKSDGVDDDPPLPEEGLEPIDTDDAEGDIDGRMGEKDDEKLPDVTKMTAQDDPRGNRIGRERPNSVDVGTDQAVAGGGIGTTLNGSRDGAQNNDGRAGIESDDGNDDNNDDDDHDLSGIGKASREEPRDKKPQFSGSGVEFADEDENRKHEPRINGKDNGSDGQNTDSEIGSMSSGGSRSDSRQNNADRSEGGDFGNRRHHQTSTMRPRGSSERGPDETDYEDLDYRDEMIEKNRNDAKRPTASTESGHNGTNIESDDGHMKHAKGKESHGTGQDKHCDDGSYGHHDSHHHDHHNTIDWLRGAIPGEPDDDYPILSRVNVSNFKCGEQKYPGYYADVESRCQVS